MKLPTIPAFVLKTPIAIKSAIGIDVDGATEYNSGISVMCRFERYKRSKYDLTTNTPLYQYVAYIIDQANISVKSKAIVDGKEYVVDKVDVHNNPDGTFNHSKLFLL